MAKASPKISRPTARPALVLVHGFRGAPLGLKKVAEPLEQAGYKVYVPAIPPFADAKKLAAYTPETYADYLAEYIRAEKLERPVLIGHSMGSVICTATAKKYPQLVNRKLILLSPIAKKPNAFFGLISPLSALLPCRIVDYVTTRFLFVPHDRKLWQDTMDITHTCSGNHPPSKSEAMHAAKFASKYGIIDFLPICNKQIFLIAGAKDRLVPQKQTKKLAHVLQAQTTFIPDSGHLHNYEKPQETAAAIWQYLED